jgi:hypothetical protein
MRHNTFSICSLLILPAVLLITPVVVQSNPAHLDEVDTIEHAYQLMVSSR